MLNDVAVVSQCWHFIYAIAHQFTGTYCTCWCARERYLKTWVPPVPESSQLSDADITQFVTGMTTVASLAMFHKAGSGDSSAALQCLAMLRPEIIIPPILDVYVLIL